LHHHLAGKAAKGCLDSVVLYIICVYFPLEIGLIEIYLAVESCFGYSVQYSIRFWDLCVIGLYVIIPEVEVY